jgi:hypothetical protein
VPLLVRVCHRIKIAFPFLLGHFDFLRMTMGLHKVVENFAFLSSKWAASRDFSSDLHKNICAQGSSQVQVDV